MADGVTLDALDLALLTALRERPRAGLLELSRSLKVARATVQSRLNRLERAGVITGYGPDIDLAAAGFPVQAFVTLEIVQGALSDVAAYLEGVPGVLEAYAITDTGDVLCKVAASSHQDLQDILLRLNASSLVARSTSVIVLSTVIGSRTLPLLHSQPRQATSRAPAFRERS